MRSSPFKFLDSYQQEDLDIFFGRERETEALYEALSGVKHLLVYGPSGAGKTSLIECGLRNQFSDADWYALSIRRGSNLLNASYAAINAQLTKPLQLGTDGLPTETKTEKDEYGQSIEIRLKLSDAIQRLFSQRFQPIYLLFDQFEELLISGSDDEKEAFFKEIDWLIRYRVPCRVLFIMREEFIGVLSEYEHLCPSIFENRFRLEKMTRGRVEGVIQSILEAEYYEDFFEVPEVETFAREVLHKLPDPRAEIDLSHVQVYLSELWERAVERDGTEKLPCLDQSLIQEKDNLQQVLNSFLGQQLSELDAEYSKGLPLEVLAVMISERNTKLQLTEASVRQELDRRKVRDEGHLSSLLDALEKRRILRKIRARDQLQYEISHDTLALVIGENRTEKMRMRQKAENIYQVYSEREGNLSREDLDLIRPYLEYLPYPKALDQRIVASQQYLVEVEAKQLKEAQAEARKNARAARAARNTLLVVQTRRTSPIAAARLAAMNYQLYPEVGISWDIFEEYFFNQGIPPILHTFGTSYEKQFRDISSLALSVDGRFLVTVEGGDRTAKLWNLETGEEIRSFVGHRDGITSVALSADGCFLVTGSHDGTAKLWDLQTGHEIRTFVVYLDKGSVAAVALSTDGRILVTGTEKVMDRETNDKLYFNEPSIKLWDLQTGENIYSFAGQTGDISYVAISPNGRFLYTSHAKLWNLQTREEIRTSIKGSIGAFSPDSRYLVTASWDYTVKLWDLETGKEIRSFTGHDDTVTSIALSADGRFLVTASLDNTAKLWNLETGEAIRTFVRPVVWVALSADGRFLLTLSDNWSLKNNGSPLKLLDFETGKVIRLFKGHSNIIKSFALSPDGRHLVTGNMTNLVELWDLETGKALRCLDEHRGPVDRIALSADGRYLVTASWDNTVKLWDLVTGDEIRSFTGIDYGLIALSADGRFLVTTGRDTAKLWNLETGEEIRSFVGHRDGIKSIALSEDGHFLVTASWDNTAILWNLETGEEIRSFVGHRDGIKSIALSEDGHFLVTASWDNTAILWNLETGEEIQRFGSHQAPVVSIALSDDGRHLVTGSHDKTAILWNLETGEKIRRFDGHSDKITSVALSADGNFLVTGSEDNTAKLWNLQNGREIYTFKGHDRSVNTLTLSADGLHLLTGSEDGTVKLWHLPPPLERRILFDSENKSRSSIAVSPNGRYLVCGFVTENPNHEAQLWDLQTMEKIRSFNFVESNNSKFRSGTPVAFSPDNLYLVTGSVTEALLWDLETGEKIRSFRYTQDIDKKPWESSDVNSIVLSTDGCFLITGGSGIARLWNLKTGEKLRTFSHGGIHSTLVALSLDGRFLVTGSEDSVKLWNLKTGEEILSFVGHSDGVTSIALSADGRFLVTGNMNYTATLWNLKTGGKIRTFSGHSSVILSIEISPDSRFLITGSGDNTVKLWNLNTGEEMRSYERLGSKMALSPDGSSLYTVEPISIHSKKGYRINQLWLPWAYFENIVRPESYDITQLKAMGLQFEWEDYEEMIREGRNWDQYRLNSSEQED